MTLDEVFADLRAGIPRLPGAKCKGRSHVWDEVDDPALVEYAIHQCEGCPALTACQRWLETLRPAQRPHGVVAGRVNRPRQPRQRQPRQRKDTASNTTLTPTASTDAYGRNSAMTVNATNSPAPSASSPSTTHCAGPTPTPLSYITNARRRRIRT